MSRKVLLVAIVVIAAALALGAVLLPRSGEWKVVIIHPQGRCELGLGELRSMASTVSVDDLVEEGVPLSAVFEKCGVVGGKSIVATGADGYTREFGYGNVSSAYLLVPEKGFSSPHGPVRIVIRGLPHKYWVKHLVRLEVRG